PHAGGGREAVAQLNQSSRECQDNWNRVARQRRREAEVEPSLRDRERNKRDVDGDEKPPGMPPRRRGPDDLRDSAHDRLDVPPSAASSPTTPTQRRPTSSRETSTR